MIRVVFRAAMTFLLVSTFYIAIGYVPFADRLTAPLTTALFRAYTWARLALFPPAPYGTIAGVTAYLGTALIVTATVTAIWSVLDRRRPHYRGLHRWLRIYLRYFLAAVMLGYGAAKIIPTQFPNPPLIALTTPLGELTRMRLLWLFMGTSRAYALFGGLAEAIGALLLFSRRTTTLGALILSVTLANVVMLNFAYEVNVRLLATVYLISALTLIAPDLPRLAHVFLFNGEVPIGPSEGDREGVPRNTGRIVKVAVVLWLIGHAITRSWDGYRTGSDGVPLPHLYGIYTVRAFDRIDGSGAVVPSPDSAWRRFVVSERGVAAIQPSEGPVRRFALEDDTIAHVLTLAPQGGPADAFTLHYAREGGSLIVTGVVDGDSVRVGLESVDLGGIPLRRPVR